MKRKRRQGKEKEREKEKKKRKEERKERRGKQKREEKKKIVCGKGKKKRGEKRVDRALSDFRCFDDRKSIGRELKLVYSTRATSRFQKHKEVGFAPTLVPLNLRVVNGRVVQPQPWNSVFGC